MYKVGAQTDTVCANFGEEITDVGSTPYSVLRPILMRIDSPAHLRQLEIASPHLQDDDAELWIRFINRQFPALVKEHRLEAKDPTQWHRVWAKYERRNNKLKEEAEQKLKAAFAGIKQKRQANVSSVVTFDRRKLPRPPKDGREVVIKAPGGRRGGSQDTGELRFTSGTRTKTTTAQSVMRKVKREAKEIHSRNRLATPGGALQVRSGQIKQAPQGMVNEQRIKYNPAVKIHPPVMKRREDVERSQEMEEREARLRGLKGKPVTFISDEDTDEDGDDDGGVFGGLDVDDLEATFDEEPKPTSRHGGSLPGRSSRPGTIPGRSGILANAPRPSSHIQRVIANPLTSRPPPSSASPASAYRPVVSSSPPPRHYSPPKPTAVRPEWNPKEDNGSVSPELKSLNQKAPPPPLKPLPLKRKAPAGTGNVFMTRKIRRT